MVVSESLPSSIPRWNDYVFAVLKEGGEADKIRILEYFCLQTELSSSEAGIFFPLIQERLLDNAPKVRYFARKAFDSLKKHYEIENKSGEESNNGEKNQILSTQEILLKKMRLGSRYVAFEAIERLVETGDPSLADPLLEFLKMENDAFKVSFLVKRLWRIPDPRIPEAVKEKLSHSDPRIVANALEGLWELDVPQYSQRFSELANSGDNRIQANAIRALFKYSPTIAEALLEELLQSSNIAQQASAIFLLKTLRPSNLDRLVDLAMNSPFASIRLGALGIPRMHRPKSVAVKPNSEDQGLQKDFFGLTGALIIAAIFTFNYNHHSFLFSVLVIFSAILLLAFSAKLGKSFLVKVALSVVFFALADDGRHALFAIPVFMIIWLGMGDAATLMASRSRFFACIFAVSTLLLSNLSLTSYLKLADALESLGEFLGRPKNVLQEIMVQKRTFYGVLFSVISLGTLFIAYIDRWFPKSDNNKKNFQYHLFAILGGAMVVLATHFSYGFGIITLLTNNGLTDPAQIMKFLTE